MATPITWRNVNGPSLAEASRPLDAAANSFNNGFDIFNRLLKEREATQAANTAQVQENQKNAYLDQLATAKTPEQLAAQADTLAQMKAALSPAARAAVRTADETRLDTLYKQTKTANEFQDYSLDRAQLPVTQNILSLASQGKKDEALALMKANPDLRLPAPMMDAIVKGDRDLTKFGWDQQNQTWKGQTHDLDMRVGESNLKTAEAQRGLIGAQAANAGIQNQIGQITLNDLKDQRQAESVIGQLGAAYQKSTDENKAKINVAAQEYSKSNTPVPINRDGSIDTSRMNSDETKKFDEYLKGKGLPDTSIYTRGDTQEAQAVRSYLVKQGLRPSVIDKLSPQIASSFNTAPMDKIGIDAYSQDLRSRQRDVINKELQERYGAVTTFNDVGSLMDAVDKEIASQSKTSNNDWFGRSAASTGDLMNIRAAAARYFKDGGVKVGTGDNATRIMPSPDEIRLIIQKHDPSSWGFSESSMLKAFEEWDKDAGKKASALYNNSLQGRVEDAMNPSKKETPKKGK